jgi:hypothetical protein
LLQHDHSGRRASRHTLGANPTPECLARARRIAYGVTVMLNALPPVSSFAFSGFAFTR